MRRVAVWGAVLLLPAAAASAPDLAAPRELGRFRVYPDFRDERRFYLAPGDLEIAVDENGRPKLHFLQMRYTGTAAYGNAGESGSMSTLTIGVRHGAPSPPELAFLQKSLRSHAGSSRIELRPLPITAFEAILAYAPIGERPSAPSIAGEGYFEADDEQAARTDPRAFWSERTFTIPLDAATSQLFWDLLHRQELAISINYAFFSRGVYSSQLASVDIESSEKDVEERLRERLKQAGVPLASERPTGIAARLLETLRAQRQGEDASAEQRPDEGPPLQSALVHSGAAAIRVDASRWPELFQRVDFNELAPPGYAALRLYCYDFKDGLRPELLFKKVEIEATAVGGRTIGLETKFLRSQPDLYARSLRFELPVLLDRPYRYRVTTARPDGALDVGPWVERESWSQILDVTSRPEEVTAAPQQPLGEEPE